MEDTLSKVTAVQQSFIKTILGMYITNNILDGSDRADVEEYINGMLAKDEFYYLVNYIVDEVIKEPEWVKFLNEHDLKPNEESFSVEEWNDIFTEVLKTITYEWLYPQGTDERNSEISDFRVLFDAELEVQAEIRKKKEEEERKKREEEEKKRKEEEEKKKSEEADAVEIKDSSVSPDPVSSGDIK